MFLDPVAYFLSYEIIPKSHRTKNPKNTPKITIYPLRGSLCIPHSYPLRGALWSQIPTVSLRKMESPRPLAIAIRLAS